MFSYVFTGEIVKMIEERYPIVPGVRGVLGFSRSTVGAVDVAVNSGTPFAYCGLVAPAMTPPMIATMLKHPAGGMPRMTILAGTYDIPMRTRCGRRSPPIMRRSTGSRFPRGTITPPGAGSCPGC
jgi:hypothetical protein